MNELDITLRVWNAMLLMLVALIVGGQYFVMYKHREITYPWWVWVPVGLYVFVGMWIIKSDSISVNLRKQYPDPTERPKSALEKRIYYYDDPVLLKPIEITTEESEKYWEKYMKKYANSTRMINLPEEMDKLNDQNT